MKFSWSFKRKFINYSKIFIQNKGLQVDKSILKKKRGEKSGQRELD